MDIEDSNIRRSRPDEIDTFAVDADIIAYRCAAVCENDPETEVFEVIDEFIFTLARDTGITKMCMFMSPSKNFRYDVATTRPYKETRHRCACWQDDRCIVYETCKWHPNFFGCDCPDYYSNSPRPKHIAAAKAYIKEIYAAVIHPGYEADDGIASYITKYKNSAHAGMDKDIKQVQGWHYDFVKKIWEYTSKEDSILKTYRQICTGDSTDSIVGIPGIGPKKAGDAIKDHKTAEQDMILLFFRNADKIFGVLPLEKDNLTDDEVTEVILKYIDEQTKLITMVTKLRTPYERYVIINPPSEFEGVDDEVEEGDFLGFDEPAKPTYKNVI